MDTTKRKILSKYVDFIQHHKKPPKSIGSFMQELKMKESTFLRFFDSFKQLEKEYWRSTFEIVLQNIQRQEVYESYSVNEKLLAFYFAWIEEVKGYREFVKYTIKEERIYELYPDSFELFKKDFEDYCEALISEGLATEEVAKRLYITDKYKYLLWYQPVSIIKFWTKDQSKDFEDTDALIEKTVNFSFDMMRSNGMDSLFDLAKFHIQHF